MANSPAPDLGCQPRHGCGGIGHRPSQEGTDDLRLARSSAGALEGPTWRSCCIIVVV